MTADRDWLLRYLQQFNGLVRLFAAGSPPQAIRHITVTLDDPFYSITTTSDIDRQQVRRALRTALQHLDHGGTA